jgi:hypothetical protein
MSIAADNFFDHDNAPLCIECNGASLDKATDSFAPFPLKLFTFDTEKEATEDLLPLQEIKAAERGMPTRIAHESNYLKHHYKYGHISMLRICAMA